MWLHIKLLQLVGFRVVGFEYEKSILNSGDPEDLLGAVDYMQEVIEDDLKQHKIAGIYGISLGSFIGFNLLKLTNIRKGMFNTGGVSAVDTIWENPNLRREKLAFVQAGYSHEHLSKKWKRIDEIGVLKNKSVILMSSKSDRVLSYDWAVKNFGKWKAAGNEVRFIKGHVLGHGLFIFKNLFRIRFTVKFYK